jgi:hypothetical protein
MKVPKEERRDCRAGDVFFVVARGLGEGKREKIRDCKEQAGLSN